MVRDAVDLQARAAEFLLNYYQAKQVSLSATAMASGGRALSVSVLAAAVATANFVTTRDLQNSPNLQNAGTLSI